MIKVNCKALFRFIALRVDRKLNMKQGQIKILKMKTNKTINVKGTEIAIVQKGKDDFISLTDMVRGFGDDTMIYSWMRNRNTLEFIGIWEEMNNPDFKGNEFVTFKSKAGLNSFNLTPKKWIDATNAIGMVSKSGRYGGGTFAHKDIAFEFGSWLSPEFKLYLIREFQRLKEDESDRLKLGWNLQRTLAKINYQIHTEAICFFIILVLQLSFRFLTLFGMTAIKLQPY